MSNGTKVVKRNGSIESLDLDKMHVMVEEACRGLAGVSASQVEMTSGIQFYDGISTQEIQEILIRSASDLIDLDHPNYQFVAARLLLFAVRKQLYGRMKELPTLEQHIYVSVNAQVYDSDIFNKSNYLVYLGQFVSSREGINLSTADDLIFINIDFSALSYLQARDRMTTKDRIKENAVHWIFAEKGIEKDIYKTVKNKENFTTQHYVRITTPK